MSRPSAMRQLVSAWGLGLLLGTVLVGRIGHRYELGRMFILGMGMQGVMLSVYAYTRRDYKTP